MCWAQKPANQTTTLKETILTDVNSYLIPTLMETVLSAARNEERNVDWKMEPIKIQNSSDIDITTRRGPVLGGSHCDIHHLASVRLYVLVVFVRGAG